MQSWNEDVTIAPHSGTQASAMAIDASSQICVLGSRRNLTFIDLQKPKAISHRVSLSNKWDVNHILWNPSSANNSYFLTAYNQYCDLWEYTEGKCVKIDTFTGHTRGISDIDWSCVNPYLMATCSMDTYFYIWDTRDVKKPKLSTSTVYGASQVKWNKFDENCIATAHDGNIRIWDIRNGKSPCKYITAHLSKINSLNWSPNNENMLSSGSQDTTIRFWDTTQSVPVNVDYPIKVQFPVWKASYTPFGTGMVSVSVLNYRETPLTLWNCRNVEKLKIHTYGGHTDVIQDYQWCKSLSDNNWQLVTWCKDQTLRLWKADYSLLWACGAVENNVEGDIDDVDEELEFYTDEAEIVEVAPPTFEIENKPQKRVETIQENSPSDNYEIDQVTPKLPQFLNDGSNLSLKQEFKLINYNLPHLRMPKFNLHQRTCTVSLHTSNLWLMIKIIFPPDYPDNVAPHFQFIKSNLEQSQLDTLLNILNETAQKHVKNSRRCLEPCLRELTTQFSKISYSDEPQTPDPEPDYNDVGVHWYQPNVNYSAVPFPRTSGARFCSVGYLVIFMRPSHVKGFHSSNEKTPRSITNLFTHRNSAPSLFGIPQNIYSKSPSQRHLYPAVSSFYYKEKRSSRKLSKQVYSHIANSVPNNEELEAVMHKPKQSITPRMAGQVIVFDLTGIMPISKVLATEYLIPSNRSFNEDCLQNKTKASAEKMTDLTQLWSFTSHLPLSKPDRIKNQFSIPLARNPTGSKCLSKIIDHYCKLKDVQTLAMLSVTFNCAQKPVNPNPVPYYHQTSQDSNIVRSVSYNDLESQANQGKLHKSPSESKFPHFGKLASILARSPTNESSFLKAVLHHNQSELSNVNRKFVNQNTIEETDLELNNPPYHMLTDEHKNQYEGFKTSYCNVLDRWKMNIQRLQIQKLSQNAKMNEKKKEQQLPAKEKQPICYICLLPVKKAVMFCMKCFHGGHANHVQAWFKTRDICPSPDGCDCKCLNTNNIDQETL